MQPKLTIMMMTLGLRQPVVGAVAGLKPVGVVSVRYSRCFVY
jgi:hypothetical protein